MIFIVGPLFLVLSLIVFQYSEVKGVKFDPVPFDNIPRAKINSNNGQYKIGVDFSIDFGDEPIIKKDNHSRSAKNMVLNVHDNGISLELECDSNDICGTSLAPAYVKIYLVNNDISYEQIINNSIPNMELAHHNCGTQSIENCANIDFSIPSNVTGQNYSIVLDMSFDEAQWVFINPVEILK